MIKKVKKLYRGHILSKEKKLLEHFTKTSCKKTNPNEFRNEKTIKRKSDKLYVKWKGYNNSFHSCINKKGIVEMSKYFPEPKYLGGDVKVKFDLSNYGMFQLI